MQLSWHPRCGTKKARGISDPLAGLGREECHIYGDGKGVFVTVSQEKWDKVRTMIEATREELERNGECANHKELERQRGFLLYVTQTYTAYLH
jgi:hypothetical protein